jgi:hypothetical protein
MRGGAAFPATTAHEGKPRKKELDHMQLEKGENGGLLIRHVHVHPLHEPELHLFGKEEHHSAIKHIAKHMGMPLDSIAKAAGVEKAAKTRQSEGPEDVNKEGEVEDADGE